MPSQTLIPVADLFEAHLTVTDLDRAVAFYRDQLTLPLARVLPDRKVAFFWIGAPGKAMLGLWEAGAMPINLSLHVAFRAALSDLQDAPARLRKAGIEPMDLDGRPTDEPVVLAWMPAASVYFRDPDNNLLEYIAMLTDAPTPALGVVPWSDWILRRPLDRAAILIEPFRGVRSELLPLFEQADDSPKEINSYIELGEVLVARRAQRIIGHIQLIANTTDQEIKSVAVIDQERGQGVGAALVHAALDQASSAGSSRVLVATATSDIENLRFYQRLGFRMDRVEPNKFTIDRGYPGLEIDGIPIRDQVWLSINVNDRR